MSHIRKGVYEKVYKMMLIGILMNTKLKIKQHTECFLFSSQIIILFNVKALPSKFIKGVGYDESG